MREDPDIAKILREEERLGILTSQSQGAYGRLSTLGEVLEDMPDESITIMEDAEKDDFYEEPIQKGDLPSNGSVDEKELIFQSSNDLMMYIDKFGKLLKINKAGLAFSGFSEEELIGKMFWKIPGMFSKWDVPKYLNVFKNALKGKPTRNFVGNLDDKSGKTHIMDFSAFPVKENKELKYVFIVAKELTEQKEAESRYRLITENTSDLICLTTFTLNPIYNYVSPSYKKVMGYEPDDLIGKPAFDFVHPDDKKNLLPLLKKYIGMKAKKLLVKKGLDVSEKFENRVRDKSGGWHYMENTANLMGDELLFVSKDITERKKAEEKIKETNNIINASPAVVFLWKNEEGWPVELVSDNVKELFGYTAKDFTSSEVPFADIIHLDDLRRASREVEKYSKEKTTKEFTQKYRIVTKNQKIKWIEDRTFIRRDEHGNITHYQGIVWDITERKQAEDALKRSEALLNATGKMAKVGGWEFDVKTLKQVWTEEVYRIHEVDMNYSPTVEKGIVFYDPATRPIIERAVQRAIEHGEPFDVELEFITAKGNHRSVHAIGKAHREDGKITKVSGTFQDITERKKIEERTKQQNKINALRAEIWELAAQPLSEDEMIQQLVDKIGPFFNLEHASFLRIYPEKKKAIVDIQWRKKDSKSGIGEEFPLRLLKRYFGKPYKVISLRNIPSIAKPIASPIFKKFGVKSTLLLPYGDIDNPQGYIATADRKADKEWSKDEIDIFSEAVGIISLKTEQIEAEEKAKNHQRKIEQQNIKLRKLDRIKTEFLNTTSHELRTPMASIKGYIQMLLKQTLGDVTPEQKDALNVVLRNTDRLDHLVQDILDISRLESGTMKFIPEKTDISKMIKESLQTMQYNAEMKNIKINTELGKNIPALTIDQERIKQVITNLVDNAIKFSPPNSTVMIRAKKDKSDVLFEVQDFGRGVPKNKQKKIFERFYQADSGMDRKFGGAGLGLTISQGIVKYHGGSIWVDNSTKGKGSTFRFNLPIDSVGNIEEKFKEMDIFELENDK